MKLHTLLATLALPFFAATAQAAIVHDTQTKTYAGTAGNTSTQQGIGPLMFSLFDLSKGTLQGIYLSYGVTISGGVSGADNQTNQVVNGTMELGGSAQFESTRRFFSNTFQSLFSPVSGSKVANFSLAADPSLAIGGNGPDVFSMAGDTFTGGLAKTQVNSLFHSDFTGLGQFAVDFRTFSILQINAPGSRGFFDAPNVNLSMSLTYVYDSQGAIDPPPADVNSPLLPLTGGLALFFLGAGTFRRKHKKNTLPTTRAQLGDYMKIKMALLSAIIATLSFTANAAFVESNLTGMSAAGTRAVNVDTDTNLGWLDLTFTKGMSYNGVLSFLQDPRLSGFRLATPAEHESMIKKIFPSLYTATSFYDGHLTAPYVNTTESGYYRTIFGGGYTYGMAYDPTHHSVHYSASNPWSVGQVGYTSWYTMKNGLAISNNNTNPLNHGDFAWYLVAEGKVSLDGSFSLKTADVSSPFLPLTGGLAMLALGAGALRRKRK